MSRKVPQFGRQIWQNSHFLEFWKKWKMGYFKPKNLCDESSKIIFLKLQFSLFFRCRRHGILCFFWRCCFHADICITKLPILRNFQKCWNFPKFLAIFLFFWDTMFTILLNIISPISICDQTQKTPCNFDLKWVREKSDSANVLVTFA